MLSLVPLVLTVPTQRPEKSLHHEAVPSCSASCNTTVALSAMLDASSCPQAMSMYEAMAKADKAASKYRLAPYNFMSVGCNRGEDLISFSQLFDESGTYDHSAWVDALLESGMDEAKDVCGATDETAQDAPQGQHRSSSSSSSRHSGGGSSAAGTQNALQPPNAVCGEAMPRNVQLLKDTQKKLPGPLRSALTIVGAAFGGSDEAGTTVTFPNCAVGTEQSGIGGTEVKNANCPNADVKMVSVDSVADSRKLPSLDALFVDTEGHDPKVLEGAVKLLSKGAVRYVEFEVHRDLADTTWATTKLGSVVGSLDANNYACYWMGPGHLTSLSDCYHPAYDANAAALTWSNVACVNRADTWFKVVDSFNKGGLCEVWS